MASRTQRRRRRRPVGLVGVLAFLVAAVATAAAVWAVWRGQITEGGTAAGVGPAASAEVAPTELHAGDARPSPSEPETGVGTGPAVSPSLEPVPPAPPAPPGGALVALVIDDLGRSLEEVRDLAGLGVPLTYAVLPFETRTAEVVSALAESRAEFLLHLPMEGRDGADPGPGALSSAMSGEQLVEGTRSALAAVPGAVGVNNHMGSVLTADRGAMRRVLRVIRGHGLYFLDSRTSPESVAFRTALDLGVPAAERHVFLDPDPQPEAIRGQFRRLLTMAAEAGRAIAIGHPYPSTRTVLAEEVPAALALGYRFVTLDELVVRGSTLTAELGARPPG